MTDVVEAVRTPPAVMGLYDGPMWASIREGTMRLQRCLNCGEMQYPPGPVCPHCLSSNLEWHDRFLGRVPPHLSRCLSGTV